jgi:hypothetical protein
VIGFEETMVWMAAGEEIRLDGVFTSFNGANVVPVVMSGTKAMSVIGERLRAIVYPATWSTDCYPVDYDDMELFCRTK